MKRPDFLVIGAMKAGSTTLYEDLYGHRDVYLPDKELGFLLDEQITSDAGQRRYDALFQSARPGQLVGDVSADYAKLPEAEGMAERAVELLGNRLRVVYSVRNPIDRVVSQHHHELSYRTISDPDIDRVVRTEPKLIAFSSYARQLEPYRRLVGDEQIKVLCFERYMQDRRAGFADLASFLGLAEQVTSTDPHRAFNAAESNTLTHGFHASASAVVGLPQAGQAPAVKGGTNGTSSQDPAGRPTATCAAVGCDDRLPLRLSG